MNVFDGFPPIENSSYCVCGCGADLLAEDCSTVSHERTIIRVIDPAYDQVSDMYAEDFLSVMSPNFPNVPVEATEALKEIADAVVTPLWGDTRIAELEKFLGLRIVPLPYTPAGF